jgi:hypothetical protein
VKKSLLTSNSLAFPRAIVFGLLAAIVGCVIWYLVVAFSRWRIGIIAVVVGYAVGWAILKSTDTYHVKFVILSLVLTLGALAMSEYLIVRHDYNMDAIEKIPLFISPVIMFSAVGESLKLDPLLIVFWAIALYEAYKIPSSLQNMESYINPKRKSRKKSWYQFR